MLLFSQPSKRGIFYYFIMDNLQLLYSTVRERTQILYVYCGMKIDIMLISLLPIWSNKYYTIFGWLSYIFVVLKPVTILDTHNVLNNLTIFFCKTYICNFIIIPNFLFLKIASYSRQEPQPAGITTLATLH